MASTQEDKQSIKYSIDKNFAYDYDVLQNIQVGSRKSSQGFKDSNKLMLSMRSGTSKYGSNELTGGEGTSEIFFFTDFFGKRHSIRGYANQLRELDDSNVWVSFSGTFSSNEFIFNTVKVPLMIDSSIPTTYVSGAVATQSEAVVVDVLDTGLADNIGKILIVTNNLGDNQSYRGCFGLITAYDDIKGEYLLGDTGILGTSTDGFETVVGLAAGSDYQIFDTVGEYLQVYNGADLEQYYYGDSSGDMQEYSDYEGFTTYSLRNIKALGDTQFLANQISYSNYYFTFNKGTLYYSGGNPNNPFFYTIVDALTIPGIRGGTILGLSVFKNRLIIAGSNFVAYINSLTDLTEVEFITTIYGMKPGSLLDLGVDSYFISTDKKIFSLSETISGTLLATNVGEKVDNYLQNFNVGICGGFDGEKLYYYGQVDSITDGVIIVLDIEFKFWSIYTGITPSSIVTEDGITYLTDRKSDTVSYFDSNVKKDVGEDIEQKVVMNEIYLDNTFAAKTISDLYLWLDNYNQELYIDTYIANPKGNGKKPRATITIEEVDTELEDTPLGEEVIGEEIMGGIAYESEISYPFMHHVCYDGDAANIWKIVITGKDGSPFYLNEFMLNISYSEKDTGVYFNAGLSR